MRMKPKETTRRRILLHDVLAVGNVHPSLHGGERTRTFGQIGTAFARVLSSTGFSLCAVSSYRNPNIPLPDARATGPRRPVY